MGLGVLFLLSCTWKFEQKLRKPAWDKKNKTADDLLTFCFDEFYENSGDTF